MAAAKPLMLAQSPYAGLAVAVAPPVPSQNPAAAPVGRGFRDVLPSHETITYTRDALVLVLFLIAFPWVLRVLLTNPGRLLQGSGVKAGL